MSRRLALGFAALLVVGACVPVATSQEAPQTTVPGTSGAPVTATATPQPSPTATPEPSPTATPGPTPTTTPTPGPTPTTPPPAGTSRVLWEARVSALPTGAGAPFDWAWEPDVATHPTDPNRMAVIYQRYAGSGLCGIDPAIRISHDGGRTWRTAKGHPASGSGRGVNFHATMVWGPGPRPGSARLYWADTTVPGCNYGAHSVSIAWSDDEGATWSRLYVERRTPPWVGGFPDITVDPNPASPNYGVVYVAYDWLADPQRGPGLRVLASADFGRTWRPVNVPKAAQPAGYGDSWRIASRLRTAPDGGLYVSSFEVDMRTWDRQHIFSRGGVRNVGRLGYAVTRLDFNRRTKRFRAQPTIMAAILSRNVYTVDQLPAPGTASNVYVDPGWQEGLDVDPVTGRVYLAVSDYRATNRGTPRGSVRVGRSDDHGRTWRWTTVPAAPPIANRVLSSFRPSLVAGPGYVVVGFHTISDLPAGTDPAWHLPTIGNAYAVSYDGGVTFGRPAPTSRVRWNAAALETIIQGPGLRDRAMRTADGDAYFVYGDGRLAAPPPSATAGRSAVFGARIEVRLPPPALPATSEPSCRPSDAFDVRC